MLDANARATIGIDMKTLWATCLITLSCTLSSATLASKLETADSVTGQDARIVGGSPVEDDRYPWIAAVMLQTDSGFTQWCGGSVIAQRWVMTAAHCVYENGSLVTPSRLAVTIGETDLAAPDIGFRTIRSFEVHPDYNSFTLHTDVALLELAEPYDGPRITLSSADNPVPDIGETVTIPGWGALDENGPSTNQLREVSIPVVSGNQCFVWNPDFHDDAVMICAGGLAEGGRDACRGDSGSPLFVTREGQIVQAGLSSFSRGCARPGVPGVYTRISSVVDWITSVAEGVATYSSASDATGPVIEPAPDYAPLVADGRTSLRSIEQGQVAFFRVETASSTAIRTYSVNGDVDIAVYTSADTFSPDTLVCQVVNTQPGAHCTVDGGRTVYVHVLGYVDSDYRIFAIDRAVTTQLVPDEPVSGFVDINETHHFLLERGDVVTLTSHSGDADLQILDTRFDVLCLSHSLAPQDTCSIDGHNELRYVSVHGFSAADYTIEVSGSSQAGNPVEIPPCVRTDSDSDGYGWGWENEASCIVLASSGGLPVCTSSTSDPDGDGYGWENEQSCIVESFSQTPESPANPVCVSAESDPDGDGWGFENGVSCVVSGSAVDVQPPARPLCASGALTDPDGDGWGFEGGQSCIVP